MSATERTVKRLLNAINQHDVGDLKEALLAAVAGGISQSTASAYIEMIESRPLTAEGEAAQAARVAATMQRVTEPGFYAHPADGRTVKVVRSKKHGGLYAMDKDANGEWRFVRAADRPSGRGLISELDASRKLDTPAASSGGDLMDLLAQLSQQSA